MVSWKCNWRLYMLFARRNKDEEDGQTVWENTGCKHVSWHEALLLLLLGEVLKVLHDCRFCSVSTQEWLSVLHTFNVFFLNYSSSSISISQSLSQPIVSDHAACQECVSLRVCSVWVECCAMLLLCCKSLMSSQISHLALTGPSLQTQCWRHGNLLISTTWPGAHIVLPLNKI